MSDHIHTKHKSNTDLDYMIPSDDSVISKEYEKKLLSSDNISGSDVNKLVEKNIKFVIHIARKYAGYGLPVEDLVNEGVIGFIKAIERFDHKRNVRLTTFASRYIRYEMIDYIISNVNIAKIATTKAQRKLFFNLKKLKKDHGLVTSEKERIEIAEKLDVSIEDVHIMESRLYGASTTYDSESDDGNSFENTLFTEGNDPASIVENEDYSEYYIDVVRKLLNINLSERDIDIFVSRNMKDEPEKLKSLAVKYDISNERVRQIELKALNMIKQNMALNNHRNIT